MVEEIRNYFIKNNIIDKSNRINVDFLGETPTEFAIMPIPVEPIIDKFINGASRCQFQFQLVSCNDYGAEVIQNIANSNFYEDLYNKITKYNKEKNLPNINGIESIECLNNGAILTAGTKTARYSIQMRIIYFKEA